MHRPTLCIRSPPANIVVLTNRSTQAGLGGHTRRPEGRNDAIKSGTARRSQSSKSLLSTRQDSADILQRMRAVAFGHERLELEVQMLPLQDSYVLATL